MIWKILFHRHLESVTTETLWRWAKGIAVAGTALWVIPDCLPFIDEAMVTWLGVSVLWELSVRGELKAAWLPESMRRRLPGPREGSDGHGGVA